MPSTATDRLFGLTTSVAVKAPCRTVATTNITLSGLQTVNGVTVVENDRVLVKSQTTESENGIYLASTGSWLRAADFDGARDVVRGTLVPVAGTGDSADLYEVTTANPITIGTTSIVFTLRYSANVRYDRTDAEIAAGVTPVNYAYAPVPEDARRFGAVDTGGSTDSTDEIQDSVDALTGGTIKGGGVWIPGDANSEYNISASITIPSRASGDNHTRWYRFEGMGRGAPRIIAKTGLIDAPMIDASGQDSSTYSFYREFCNFYLNGAGIAQRGIELYYNQHFKVENVFITGLDNGSSIIASGVRVFGAICSQFRDIKVHDCEGYGIFAHGGSGNFFNANLIEGCSFLNLTSDGFYSSGGFSGCAYIGNTNEFCDGYGLRLAGYAGSCGLIAGNYFEANGLADIYIGEETAANSVVIEGNYLNGYSAGVSSTAYTPIRLKFGDGVVICGNMVQLTAKSTTGYLFLDANISGGSVSNCVVEHNQVRSLALATAPNTIYNLPGNWVHNGNRLIDEAFAPLVETNLTPDRLPYGSWTLSVTGSATIRRVAAATDAFFGMPMVRATNAAASTCSITRTVTLETGSRAKNRFCTFAVPIMAIVGSTGITVTITPNGTSPQATTITTSSLGANESTIAYAMGFVPSDATQIAVEIALTSSTSDFYIGQPCLYVGARRWYSAAGESFWRTTRANLTSEITPTAGAWLAGDTIFYTNPAASGFIGTVCVTAGSQGTWKRFGTIEA